MSRTVVKAAIYAVLLVSLIFPAFSVFKGEFGGDSWLDILGFWLFYYSVYLCLSLLGWLFVGWPCHLLIQRYGAGRLVWYLLAVVAFAIAVALLIYPIIGVVLGGAALLQMLLFRLFCKRAINLPAVSSD